MRVAGIELEGGRRIWADAGDCAPEVLDWVLVLVGDTEVEGWVFVAPGQMVAPPPAIQGKVLRKRSSAGTVDTAGLLPGADLPPLGTDWTAGGVTGTVVALDPVNRTVTLEVSDGSTVVAPFDPAPAPVAEQVLPPDA